MISQVARYYHWLHGKWPAGTVEKLPVVGEAGLTNVAGLRVVGDLSGVPLLKFSSETGAQAVRAILAESSFPGERSAKAENVYDVVIIGAGVSGISAAMEARQSGLKYLLIEASQIFSTVANFPKAKPIFTYPTEMTPSGGIQYGERSGVKESLLADMQAQVEAAGIEITQGRVEQIKKAGRVFELVNANSKEGQTWKTLRVVVGIGRSGNFRKLGVPGEAMDKVMNRLHDPKDYGGKDVMVVGGGDSAAEAAIALAACGARVTLSYRKPDLNRPKPENVEKVMQLAKDPCAEVAVDRPSSERVTTAASSEMREGAPGCLNLELGTAPTRIEDGAVYIKAKGGEEKEIKNDAVFAMIGREAPLDFFRKSKVKVTGDWGAKAVVGLVAFLAVMAFLYHLKAYKTFLGIEGTNLWQVFASKNWFPFNLPVIGAEGGVLHTIMSAAKNDPGFTFAFLYTCIIVVFGLKRIKRRKTPYVRRQTLTLMAFQVIPLFLIPYIVLPVLYNMGAFTSGGIGQWFGMTFLSDGQGGDPNQFWRAFGFILAWPLFIYNIFTEAPIWGWIVLGFIQSFVIIPLIVRRWGKGAYCGWICSCGAMAETLGDAHRHKMPHGPIANKLNMIGQGVLVIAFILLILRIVGWVTPWNGFDQAIAGFIDKNELLSYKVLIDLWLAGAIGYGLYFHYSGRAWCRFACPLAALMHIYARFTQFRIFAEKKKCISCNVCTSVCHQGIDIMNFANKGLPMEDPECVRCSACVQSCPTGVLQFGRLDAAGGIRYDSLSASPVLMREMNEVSPVDKLLASGK
ncbi:MAG: NAD(P)-binding domain-containing protein [Verrucomicrobiota bacterium]